MIMRKIGVIIAIVLIAVTFTSCDDGGKYQISDNAVFYSYWTFSFGTVHDRLPDADAATFQSVEDWLGRDARHVYFKDRLVTGADPATVEADKYPLFHDSKDYYFMGAPLCVAGVNSFKVIKSDFEDHIWATDGKYAFFDSVRIEGVDLPSFKVDLFCLARDKNHVYRFGKILPGADPATYKETISSGYATDKDHVWYYGTLMDNVDRATFKDDGEGKAHDKWGNIESGQRVDNNEDASE